jgi:hypothetical protein
LTSVLPSILLSLPGGVLGDALPNKLTLTWTLVLRIGVSLILYQHSPGLGVVLALTTVNWAVYQFYTPGENSALPALVQATQLAKATALLQAASLLAQLGGAGLLAPLSLTVLGERGLFAIVAALLAAALVLFLSIPRLSLKAYAPATRTGWLRALPVGIRTIHSNGELLRATILRVTLDTGFVMLVVAAPKLVTEVLQVAPENTVYVVAPGALGLAAGLALAPTVGRLLSQRFCLWTGYCLVILAVLLLAGISDVARFLDERTFLPLRPLQEAFGVRREIAATILVLPLGGLGVSLVQVSSRATVYEVAPPQAIAQVFASQSAIGSLAALIPTLIAGLILDFLAVPTVLALIGLFLAVAPIAAIHATRMASPGQSISS